MRKLLILVLLLGMSCPEAFSEDGYRLWLRYQPLNNQPASSYKKSIRQICIPDSSETQLVIRREWSLAWQGMTGLPVRFSTRPTTLPSVNYIRFAGSSITNIPWPKENITDPGEEGYSIISQNSKGSSPIFIIANTDKGWLYATFHLLRVMQMQQPLTGLHIFSKPRIQKRLLNHWDNLDRSVERGYAGQSIWNWHTLPGFEDKRYTDYARANASVGINGTVLTNVNANATILTRPYLEKVKKLADIFRPYGIQVYLTARFSAPIEAGKLSTADPLNESVKMWWAEKAREIYSLIPDFGGFLVKANSEGQPGPQNYGRSHADGANMLADAVAPFGGIVMWRAFVYSNELPEDRHKQANIEFEPLDGAFRDNVIIQVKNGAIDFQPREPFHPLFGKMPRTPLMLELQLTQEYLGQATSLVYLAPLFKECLDSDTYQPRKGHTVAKIIDGTSAPQKITAIAGVANIGNDINWTDHPIAQSNWYAYGRLAWDHQLQSREIADEWLRMTFSNDPSFTSRAIPILLNSRETCVKYMTPLGLHHLMGTGHHYGPAPWVHDLPRADWTPVYYHKADKDGIGFNRTKTGSNAIGQYADYWQQQWNDPAGTDENLLLWFHHLPWDYKMRNGESLWTTLCKTYDQGVKEVRAMRDNWQQLQAWIDAERFTHVNMLLAIQEEEARWWRNACLLYFREYAARDFPSSIEQPQGDLEYYKSLAFPYAPGN